jgi:hypothetical protein
METACAIAGDDDEQIGRAMVNVAALGAPKQVLENKDINEV